MRAQGQFQLRLVFKPFQEGKDNVEVTNGNVHEFVEDEATLGSLMNVFERALNLAIEKDDKYAGAWRTQGFMGNLARILSKAARLKSMCWKDAPEKADATKQANVEETIDDTLLDMVNLAAFARENFARGNRWGL